jgi:hypothetical protein
MDFVNLGVVEILIVDSFGPLKSCAGKMGGSLAYTLAETGRTLIWDSHRPEHRG